MHTGLTVQFACEHLLLVGHGGRAHTKDDRRGPVSSGCLESCRKFPRIVRRRLPMRPSNKNDIETIRIARKHARGIEQLLEYVVEWSELNSRRDVELFHPKGDRLFNGLRGEIRCYRDRSLMAAPAKFLTLSPQYL